jgi:hypothetical protein
MAATVGVITGTDGTSMHESTFVERTRYTLMMLLTAEKLTIIHRPLYLHLWKWLRYHLLPSSNIFIRRKFLHLLHRSKSGEWYFSEQNGSLHLLQYPR